MVELSRRKNSFKTVLNSGAEAFQNSQGISQVPGAERLDPTSPATCARPPRGLTPLLMAAEEGHSAVVRQVGASLEATDHSGSRPSNGVGSCSQVKGGEKFHDMSTFVSK